MAETGQTSTQARHSVQRASTGFGRPGAGSKAWVGQVMMHAPQAVQSRLMVITGNHIPAG
jgi:hypothetical protein